MLLIDAGNTHVKLRSWNGQNMGPSQLLDNGHEQLLPFRGTQAWISCVARNSVREDLQHALSEHGLSAHWARSPAQGLGIRNAYPQPERLGVDRWLALAAAFHQCQTSCCVIDAGTAITADFCDAQGQHLGGLIAPGLQALNQALRQDTSLPWVEAGEDQTDSLELASDTESALRLGALHSACGLLERCTRLARQRFACEQLFITGGHARLLLQNLPHSLQEAPDLVFQGLALLAASQNTGGKDSL